MTECGRLSRRLGLGRMDGMDKRRGRRRRHWIIWIGCAVRLQDWRRGRVRRMGGRGSRADRLVRVASRDVRVSRVRGNSKVKGNRVRSVVRGGSKVRGNRGKGSKGRDSRDKDGSKGKASREAKGNKSKVSRP